ncbi:MAG: hypothetical protein ACOX6T_26735 [Myxococcales bacterium]|jgi:hypothetical protein
MATLIQGYCPIPQPTTEQIEQATAPVRTQADRPKTVTVVLVTEAELKAFISSLGRRGR